MRPEGTTPAVPRATTDPVSPSNDPEPSPLRFLLFADANYGITSSHRDSPSAFLRAYATSGSDGGVTNGFALEWLGLDATYDGGEVGVTASLRFGDATPAYIGNDAPPGIANLAQGYLTWSPSDAVQVDLGQFATVYGAEVAESWRNLNYTRGGLYYAMQPFWHTGLRGHVQLSETFALNALLVNGVNSSFDDDDAPSAGLQAIASGKIFSLKVGGFQTFDTVEDDSGFDTFVDVVATIDLDAFRAVFNADYNRNKLHDVVGPKYRSFYGASGALGYALTDAFGIAARYEFLSDSDNTLAKLPGAESVVIHTITGTVDFKPIPRRDNLIVRWDNRFEQASEDAYTDANATPTDSWFASVVGVVVKTDE